MLRGGSVVGRGGDMKGDGRVKWMGGSGVQVPTYLLARFIFLLSIESGQKF